MLKNHKLAGAIQDVNLGEFKVMLKYKAEWYGREVIEINRFFPSSKLCSNCGYKNTSLTLKDREWVCPECGERHDRDVNAAINIKKEGIRIIGSRCPELTLEDCPLMDDPASNGMLKSQGRLNQEEAIEEITINGNGFLLKL